MRDGKLCVVARVRATYDQTERVREILEELVEPTRAEAGCHRYDLFVSEEDPGEFVFIEEWEDETALTSHFATTHFEASGAALTGLLAEPTTILRYSRVR